MVIRYVGEKRRWGKGGVGSVERRGESSMKKVRLKYRNSRDFPDEKSGELT